MFCTQCGTQVANGVNFCPSCGNNLRAAAEAIQAPPNSGPQKVSAVEPRLPQAHAPEPTSLRADPQADPRTSGFALSSRIRTAAAGGALVLVLAAGGYWTWSNFAPRSGGASAGPAANSAWQRDANTIAAPAPGGEQRGAGIMAAGDSGGQAEIAAARAALDREIAAEESEARERASRSTLK